MSDINKNVQNKKVSKKEGDINRKGKTTAASKHGKKKKKRVSESTRVMIIFIIVAMLFCIGGCIYLLKNSKAGKPVKDNSRQNTTEESKIIKEFVGLEKVEGTADISKYYTYGTSLCVEGSVTAEQLAKMQLTDIDKAVLVLKKAYTNEDGSVNDDNIYEYTAYTEISEDVLSFRTYTKINEGVCLENIEDGEYIMLLEIKDTAGKTKYCTFNNDLDSITYYTITKNGINQKIYISAKMQKDKKYTAFNVEQTELPENVYDIVLDPGHGGNDPGAVNGEYNEAVLMLEYGQAIKEALEASGYKVALTRDGSEPADEKMAYTMYDENGRVNKAGKTNAKICLSLHLNSNAISLNKGGIQIYYTFRGSEKFAKNLADNIVTSSGTYVSPMSAYRVDAGVYTRGFSEEDLEEAKAEAVNKGFEPYPATTDTDYYFMIRELGGIATNAYVDGRNSRYGINSYKDSMNGIESCILELGFISVDEDLEHIVNNRDGYVRGVVNGINEWVKTITEAGAALR